MPERIIVVKSVQEDPNVKTNTDTLDQIFPLIVHPMKRFGVWPSKSVMWRKYIFIFLAICYVQGPMLVYAIKNMNNFLEASYAICI